MVVVEGGVKEVVVVAVEVMEGGAAAVWALWGVLQVTGHLRRAVGGSGRKEEDAPVWKLCWMLRHASVSPRLLIWRERREGREGRRGRDLQNVALCLSIHTLTDMVRERTEETHKEKKRKKREERNPLAERERGGGDERRKGKERERDPPVEKRCQMLSNS